LKANHNSTSKGLNCTLVVYDWINFGSTSSTYTGLSLGIGTMDICVTAVCGGVESGYSSYVSIYIPSCRTTVASTFEDSWELSEMEKTGANPPSSPTGIENNNSQPITMEICPNPVHSFIQIRNADNDHLIITDLLGKTLKDINVPSNGKIDVSELSNGMYLIRDITNSFVTKFIKE